MAKFQFDKKQLPAVAGMGIVSAGLLTYFAVKISTPPPIQAAQPSKSRIAQAALGHAMQANATKLADASAGDDLLNVAAPSDGRDPFVPAIDDSGAALPAAPVRMAKASRADDIPSVPGLPPVGGLAPMSLAPGSRVPGSGLPSEISADTWTVTGVLFESSEPRNRMAILRSGDVRRFVRVGDMVDGSLRLVAVRRGGVTLAYGSHLYRLPLGGDPVKKPASAAPGQPGAAGGPSQGVPATPAPATTTPANPSPISAAPTTDAG